jgi:predicted MPP superfamily phosphohydrolase
VQRVFNAALLALAWILGRLQLYPRLQVTRHAVTVAGLPPELNGFTVVQVSDLHVGPGSWAPPNWRDAALEVRAGEADIVANTGDFLQWEPPPEKARRVFEQFLPGSGRGSDPALAIAILGNHDYYAGEAVVRSLEDELAGEGVHVLTNDIRSVSHAGGELTVAGLTIFRPGLDEAIERLLKSARPRIVLVHNPDEARLLPAGCADLVIAGHTHGGQITLPWLEPFIVRRFCGSQFVEGWYRVNDNPLYVNRGLGCTGYPVRFRARPEVSIFRLTR